MAKNLLKVIAWASGGITVLAALIYLLPFILQGADAAFGTSLRAKVLPSIEPAWIVFPWVFAAPVVCVIVVVALWLLRRRERAGEADAEVHYRSTFLDTGKPLSSAEPVNEPTFDEIIEPGVVSVGITEPTIHDYSVQHPDEEPDSGTESAGSGLNEPETSSQQSAGLVAVPEEVDIDEPVSPEQNAALTEAQEFISNPAAVSDISAWVSSLVDASVAPFEEAVESGGFDVGLRPESARVLYTGLLEQEAARRHALAVEESGLDETTITELTGR